MRDYILDGVPLRQLSHRFRTPACCARHIALAYGNNTRMSRRRYGVALVMLEPGLGVTHPGFRRGECPHHSAYGILLVAQ